MLKNMSETESVSHVHIQEKQEKAAWTTGGPLKGKTRQLRTIISLLSCNPCSIHKDAIWRNHEFDSWRYRH